MLRIGLAPRRNAIRMPVRANDCFLPKSAYSNASGCRIESVELCTNGDSALTTYLWKLPQPDHCQQDGYVGDRRHEFGARGPAHSRQIPPRNPTVMGGGRIPYQRSESIPQVDSLYPTRHITRRGLGGAVTHPLYQFRTPAGRVRRRVSGDVACRQPSSMGTADWSAEPRRWLMRRPHP